MTRSRQTADWGSRAGLAKVIPSSVAVAGSGATGSASALGTVTFSSCTSLSLNGVFSATYTEYRIILNCSGSNDDLYFRMRVSGADLTSSVYHYSSIQNTSNDVNVGTAVGDGVAQLIFGETATGKSTISCDIFNPFATTYTTLGNHFSKFRTATTESSNRITGGAVNNTTSYDGFTLYTANAFAFSGTISVYGYTI